MLGPYYKYRTYYDMIHNERAYSIPTLSPMLTCLKSVPFVAAGFLLASHYFSIQVSPTDSVTANSFSLVMFLLPRSMECRRGLAMRILSVRPSVRPSVCHMREL